MRERLPIALAAAFILCGMMVCGQVEAMPAAAASAHAVATTDAGFVQRVAVVCGNGGCVRVQTTRVQRHRLPHH